MNKELDNLFDEKINEIHIKEENEKKRIDETNRKYANAYVELVKSVISIMTDFDKRTPINTRKDIIGNYIVHSDKMDYDGLVSEAILTKNMLDIILVFNEYRGFCVNKEEGYDENMVNQMLNNSNINIHTKYDDGGGMCNTSITVTYKRNHKD